MSDQFAADRILETAEEMEKALRQIKDLQIKDLLIEAHHDIDGGNYNWAKATIGRALDVIEKGPRLTTIITNTEALKATHPTTSGDD